MNPGLLQFIFGLLSLRIVICPLGIQISLGRFIVFVNLANFSIDIEIQLAVVQLKIIQVYGFGSGQVLLVLINISNQLGLVYPGNYLAFFNIIAIMNSYIRYLTIGTMNNTGNTAAGNNNSAAYRLIRYAA